MWGGRSRERDQQRKNTISYTHCSSYSTASNQLLLQSPRQPLKVEVQRRFALRLLLRFLCAVTRRQHSRWYQHFRRRTILPSPCKQNVPYSCQGDSIAADGTTASEVQRTCIIAAHLASAFCSIMQRESSSSFFFMQLKYAVVSNKHGFTKRLLLRKGSWQGTRRQIRRNQSFSVSFSPHLSLSLSLSVAACNPIFSVS